MGALVRFVAVTLIIAGLDALIKHGVNRDEGDEAILPCWIGRLLDELPCYVGDLVGGTKGSTAGEDEDRAGVTSARDDGDSAGAKCLALKRTTSCSRVVMEQINNAS